MREFYKSACLIAASAVLIVTTSLPAAAFENFEYRDGESRPVHDIDARESNRSNGVPWARQTAFFPSQSNSTGNAWLDGTIDLSAVKTCSDGSVVLALQITALNFHFRAIAYSVDELVLDGYRHPKTWISREPRNSSPQIRQPAEYHQAERKGDELRFYFEGVGTANPFIINRKDTVSGPITYIRTNSPFMTRRGTITLRGTSYDQDTQPDGTVNYTHSGNWETTVENVLAPGDSVIWDRHFRPCFSIAPEHMANPDEPTRFIPDVHVLPPLRTLR